MGSWGPAIVQKRGRGSRYKVESGREWVTLSMLGLLVL